MDVTARPTRWAWYWALPVAAGAALIATGGVASLLGLAVFAYTAWGFGMDRWRRRRNAKAALRALPFVVTQHPPDGDDADLPARELMGVHVRLRGPVGHLTGQRACRTAMDAAPGLRAELDGDVVALIDWPWGKSDLLLLAQLLSTWGVAVHGECGIVEAEVRWGPRDGPLASL